MNTGNTVYLIRSGTLHNKTINDSVTVLPAKIDSIANDMLLLEIKTTNNKSILLEVRKSEVYETFTKALEEVQTILSNAKLETDEN